ncbi:MAG TPA: hypothetical protein VMP01_12020 [Pirellulaceae bacterium]|nr:hypothetical protein [Pirellulaceae bacterium]
MFKVCPICQQQVAVYEWAVHEMQHRGQPQMLTAGHGRAGPSAAIGQAAGKAPRIYHHPRCGHATALPDAAVYAHLQDPFCSSDQAYCSGCKGYVSTGELFWEGTSESLLSYDRRQKAEYIRAHALNPNDFVWDSTGPVRRKSQSNWGAIVGLGIGGLALVCLLGVGLVIALAVRSHRNAAAAARPVFPVVQPAAAPMGPQPARGVPIARPNPLDDIRVQQDDIFAEMRKHQEEARRIMEQAQPQFAPPPSFDPPDSPFGDADPAAEARRSMEEARQRSQKMRDDLMERSRQRREESRKRMEEMRSRQFP